jgi:hypothetical protein
MDDYMRENKLEAVVPTLGPDGKKTAGADDGSADAAKADAAADKPADKTAKAPAAKPDKIAKIDKSAAEKPVEH